MAEIVNTDTDEQVRHWAVMVEHEKQRLCVKREQLTLEDEEDEKKEEEEEEEKEILVGEE